MNYRHLYHAGNHADVLKHAVLARIATYLAVKDKAFAALDAHAGLGSYDLQSVQAQKTGEWQGGVGLLADPLPMPAEALLAPYRSVLSILNPQGGLRHYPGSPEILKRFLRDGDRLIVNELHPDDGQILKDNYTHDTRITITTVDAFSAIKAQLPFKERRGLVLIDPPYERTDEIQQNLKLLREGLKRFASGTFILWYPVTTDAFVDELVSAAQSLGVGNMLLAELRVKIAREQAGLCGSGLIIINPPFTLHGELAILLPALAERVGIEGQGQSQLEWLTPPR